MTEPLQYQWRKEPRTPNAKKFTLEVIAPEKTVRLVVNSPDTEQGRGTAYKELTHLLNGSCPSRDEFHTKVEDLYFEWLSRVSTDDPQNAASMVANMALERATYFMDQSDRGYARIPNDGVIETRPLRSTATKNWLRRLYHSTTSKVLSSNALTDAIGQLEAAAQYSGPRRPVGLRVQGSIADRVIYIDLCDDDWSMVEIRPDGWKVVPQNGTVHFRRSPVAMPLPVPRKGGDLNQLRRLLNLTDDKDFRLIVAWLLGAFHPAGPYPVLVLTGEQGAAKSTTSRILASLVDPNRQDSSAQPRSEQDFAIRALNRHVINLDNLSHLPDWLSDALCRLATGGSFEVRKLWTDDEEVYFYAVRPVVLNGIENIVTKNDLADRAVFVELPVIRTRINQAKLFARLDKARPFLFGAICDVLCACIANAADLDLSDLPRMADWATWITAAEPALGWEPGTFLSDYRANQEESVPLALMASPVATYLLEMFDGKGETETTWTDLLDKMKLHVQGKGDRPSTIKGFPSNPRRLSEIVKRDAPVLRKMGIEFATRLDRTKTGKRQKTVKVFYDTDSAYPAYPAYPPTESVRELPLEQANFGYATPVEVAYPDPQSCVSTDPEARTFTLITDEAAAYQLAEELSQSPLVGFDLETTSLNPRVGRIRLAQFATANGVWVIDVDRVGLEALRVLVPLIPRAAGHNLAFEIAWLLQHGIEVPERLADSMLMAQVLEAGAADASRMTVRVQDEDGEWIEEETDEEFVFGGYSLADVADRYLGVKLDKTAQKSDWSGELTEAQLEYAAMDARVMLPLVEKLDKEAEAAKLTATIDLEMEALPAVAWMSWTGVGVDVDRWTALAIDAEKALMAAEKALNEEVSRFDRENLFGDSLVDWDSLKRVKQLFAERGHHIESTDKKVLFPLAQQGERLAQLLLDYREHRKKVETYGQRFIGGDTIDPASGRIHPTFAQAGARTGRMACRNPNMQNLPKDPKYRACFTPADGRVLVKVDYAAIEMRVAAEIAGDFSLVKALRSGEDIHVRTARTLMGDQWETLTDAERKGLRQAAKAVNFGLLYGMGVKGLAEYASRPPYSVKMTDEEAAEWYRAYFTAYPGLRAWHNRIKTDDGHETRTVNGRRRLGVTKLTDKANTPVQGTAADGMKAALDLIWQERERYPTAAPVLCVHDELVVECDEADAAEVQAWVESCMKRGMERFIKKVPITVEGGVLSNWGGLE